MPTKRPPRRAVFHVPLWSKRVGPKLSASRTRMAHAVVSEISARGRIVGPEALLTIGNVVTSPVHRTGRVTPAIAGPIGIAGPVGVAGVISAIAVAVAVAVGLRGANDRATDDGACNSR